LSSFREDENPGVSPNCNAISSPFFVPFQFLQEEDCDEKIEELLEASVRFDWAYQLQAGNPELAPKSVQKIFKK
jgi:hypothetical protein